MSARSIILLLIFIVGLVAFISAIYGALSLGDITGIIALGVSGRLLSRNY